MISFDMGQVVLKLAVEIADMGVGGLCHLPKRTLGQPFGIFRP